MTIKEKEDFINSAFANLPLLSGNDYYTCRYLIRGFDNNTRFELYEDTEYNSSNSSNVFSRDTNYSIYLSDVDNGSIPMKHLFNVDYIFKDETGNTESSYYGCLPPASSGVDDSVFTWVYDSISNNLELWYLHYEDSGTGYKVGINHDNSYGYYSGNSNDDSDYVYFSDLQSAKNYCINLYKDEVLGVGNIFAKYNPILRNYVECLNNRVDKCCLLYC